MKLHLDDKVYVHPDVIYKTVDGVVYILDTQQGVIRTLNATASFIWLQLLKPKTVKQVVTLICDKFEVNPREANKDCLELLEKYRQLHLIKVHPK